jgi:hypothetical protein
VDHPVACSHYLESMLLPMSYIEYNMYLTQSSLLLSNCHRHHCSDRNVEEEGKGHAKPTSEPMPEEAELILEDAKNKEETTSLRMTDWDQIVHISTMTCEI